MTVKSIYHRPNLYDCSEHVWWMVIHRLGFQPFLFHTLTALTEWLRMKHGSCSSTLKCLVGQATVSKLWSE